MTAMRSAECGVRNCSEGSALQYARTDIPHSAFRIPHWGGAVRVVVVFGGGGAKSLAHAGAWRALLEAGLRPSHIVGTSMGAVVGAAFAAGSSYDRFVAVARSLGSKDVAALDRFAVVKGVFAANIFKPGPLRHTIARLVPAARFADPEIPLPPPAT